MCDHTEEKGLQGRIQSGRVYRVALDGQQGPHTPHPTVCSEWHTSRLRFFTVYNLRRLAKSADLFSPCAKQQVAIADRREPTE